MLAFLNASAVEGLMGLRADDWSSPGIPVIERNSFCRGFNHPVLHTLTSQGVLALNIFEGSINKYRFDRFLHEGIVRSVLALNRCTANLPPHVVLAQLQAN